MSDRVTAPKQRVARDRQAFIVALTKLHDRAHRIGLHATGHALHDAVRVVGYEVASKQSRKRGRAPRSEGGRG